MIFVQAVDYMYYSDPQFYDVDWAVSFSDGVGIIAIKSHRNTNVSAGLKRSRDRLRKCGISYGVVSEIDSGVTTCYFPKPHAGRMFEFVLTAPIPIPSVFGSRVGSPGSAPALGFSLQFPTIDVLAVFQSDVDVSPSISNFVLDGPVLSRQIEKKRLVLRNEILRQYPRLIEERFSDCDVSRLVAALGDDLRLMRRSYREKLKCEI